MLDKGTHCARHYGGSKRTIKAAARSSKISASEKFIPSAGKDHGPRLQVWRPQVHLHQAVQVRHRRVPLRQLQKIMNMSRIADECNLRSRTLRTLAQE
ncbi:hypothetical protein V5799_024205 [Amblyomma americanum]|uniref:Uncharacterized protein n=1 Tax=Amblyomma americanum TaxID=6943 RepID=A0AAQ4ECP3_AMBAM